MLKVSINDRALTNIISRNKKIEGRLNKGIFKNMPYNALKSKINFIECEYAKK